MRAKATASPPRFFVIRGFKNALWFGIAFMSCLTVLAVNGSILFYFDSSGYLIQGFSAFSQAGIHISDVPQVTDASGNAAAQVSEEANNTVNGSRSLVYGLVLAAVAAFARVEFIALFNTALVFLAVLLPVRVATRRYGIPSSLSFSVSIPILVAATSALPFYVAYAMPDVFAAVLLLVVATFTAFAPTMRKWEVFLGLALASLAVLSHPSHILMTIVLVPISAVISGLLHRRKAWVAPLLILVLVAVAFSERVTFKIAVEETTESKVVYFPILTARLIADGPGLKYLEDNCPNAGIATCALFEALQKSDDPMRLTASHIIFASDPALGSYRLMTEEDQRRVGEEQIKYFFNVLRSKPVPLILAFGKNTLEQALTFKIDMTIPSEAIIARVLSNPRLPPDTYSRGSLKRTQTWVRWVNYSHAVIYATALVVIFFLLIRSEGLPRHLRVLALMMLLGILVNALVCGGLSQPADRYGARVIWLLPLLATMMVLFRNVTSRRREA